MSLHKNGVICCCFLFRVFRHFKIYNFNTLTCMHTYMCVFAQQQKIKSSIRERHAHRTVVNVCFSYFVHL